MKVWVALWRDAGGDMGCNGVFRDAESAQQSLTEFIERESVAWSESEGSIGAVVEDEDGISVALIVQPFEVQP